MSPFRDEDRHKEATGFFETFVTAVSLPEKVSL